MSRVRSVVLRSRGLLALSVVVGSFFILYVNDLVTTDHAGKFQTHARSTLHYDDASHTIRSSHYFSRYDAQPTLQNVPSLNHDTTSARPATISNDQLVPRLMAIRLTHDQSRLATIGHSHDSSRLETVRYMYDQPRSASPTTDNHTTPARLSHDLATIGHKFAKLRNIEHMPPNSFITIIIISPSFSLELFFLHFS